MHKRVFHNIFFMRFFPFFGCCCCEFFLASWLVVEAIMKYLRVLKTINFQFRDFPQTSKLLQFFLLCCCWALLVVELHKFLTCRRRSCFIIKYSTSTILKANQFGKLFNSNSSNHKCYDPIKLPPTLDANKVFFCKFISIWIMNFLPHFPSCFSLPLPLAWLGKSRNFSFQKTPSFGIFTW